MTTDLASLQSTVLTLRNARTLEFLVIRLYATEENDFARGIIAATAPTLALLPSLISVQWLLLNIATPDNLSVAAGIDADARNGVLGTKVCISLDDACPTLS